jgi:hypothetical protein
MVLYGQHSRGLGFHDIKIFTFVMRSERMY